MSEYSKILTALADAQKIIDLARRNVGRAWVAMQHMELALARAEHSDSQKPPP